MDRNPTSPWQERTTQQLVRYEAVFKLLDDIQQTESVEEIARRVSRHWKYFANVTCWRLVLPKDEGFQVIDSSRGEAQLASVVALDAWDAFHLSQQKPRLVRPAELSEPPYPPEHLAGKAITEIQVLPFVRLGQCIGLLSTAARHEPFNELDIKFIRLFGSHLTDRLSSIELRRQAMNALVDKATRDALTGLLNRGAIIERLDRQLAQAAACGEPLSVILADLDFFKAINDNHGHLAGDQVLREVSRRLQAQTLSGDSLGRYGGEEFLFILYPCSAEDAEQAAERLRRIVAENPIKIDAEPPRALGATISLGAASTRGHDRCRLEELIKRADDALYQSKAAGRNRVTVG
ncbi:GGDEF domain-containing protein [Thiorhodococcus mannitoliphagus]|uniref:diguanylate cyclase n=1 Tax=Thiorhodococcus mannitoliphagus TaxID=329406 RepID=A0A6P1DX31_9GAMM|nr:GGDEF domain-containing protein [Thiorhodococcus mannitoliphagus]NEX20264.1 GGDEF domain-containing protein [Thiorhodococcus mannitoliphagus]